MSTKTKSKSELLQGLNESQLKAVTFGQGPLLIVAGAGTGKTTVITRRVAHLIEQGVKPDEILALTFTDKAAAEMEERVDRLLPYGYYDLWISTFHAFCERILKQHALDIGISNDFKLLDTTQQWLLVRQNLEKFDLDYYRPIGNPTKFIYALLKHFSKAKDEEIFPEEYLEFAQKVKLDKDNPDFDEEDEVKRVNEVANAYHVYQKLLLDQNALDFGDLINYTLKLFRTRKKILKHYQDKFKYILVDEFQDTNYAQYELVKLLAGDKKNISVVGDDDQSIYKFRGASVSNILQFKKDYPETKEITLTENYRSNQNILDTAYSFIQLNNPERLEAKLSIEKKLKSQVKGKGIISVLSGQTLTDEVDLVVKKIIELKEKGALWNEFAILVRANDQADVFISKLASLGIPYTFFANRGLYKKPIIVDVVSYLKLLMDYHDSACMYKVLNLHPFHVDHNDLVDILHYAHKKTLSLYEALQQAALIPNLKKETLQKVEALLGMLQKHSILVSQKNVVELFINVVKDLRIADRIKDDTIENLENREILEQFYKKIEQFEAENTDKSTKHFLEMFEFELEAGEEGKINYDPNQGPESVKIMTIHSAKGLEFENVFIVNMVHLRFPSVERKEAIEIPKALVKEILPEGDIHLQEERRLFYVAMTRAKNGLFFSYAEDYGGQRAKKPSQFLMDVGLVEKPQKSLNIVEREKIKVEPSKPDPNLFLPNTFSFTQISEFRKCPMRFKYRHLLRLPLPGNHHLSFGNTIHATLEKFLAQYKNSLEMTQLDLFDRKKKNELPEFEDLVHIYEQSWVDEWYTTKKQKEQYRERGLKMLKDFYEGFRKEPVAPKYLEKSFRMEIGDYYFLGKIDRADQDQEGLNIIDYKTGETKLDRNKEDRYQLLAYQWAAQDYLKEKVKSLSYWYLVDGTVSEPFLGSDADLNELKTMILDTIEEIRDAVRNNSFKELDKKVRHDCEFEDFD